MGWLNAGPNGSEMSEERKVIHSKEDSNVNE